MGFVFILDRLTGKPLFLVEERPVPESNVSGEEAWPTQPFPLKPPPLVRQTFSEADISEVTKESHEYCAELAHSLKTRGMYTPYGLELTLVMPGTLGGGNWSGASFDKASGYLFVNANEFGAVGAMLRKPMARRKNIAEVPKTENTRGFGIKTNGRARSRLGER